MSEPYESPVRNQLYQLGIFLWTARESNPTHSPCKGESPKPWNMAAHFERILRLELRSQVWKTRALTIVLYPHGGRLILFHIIFTQALGHFVE